MQATLTTSFQHDEHFEDRLIQHDLFFFESCSYL
jgi:hypothetical protein